MKTLCSAKFIKTNSYFTRDIYLFVFLFVFGTCLKWAGLSWKNVMSHISVHQSAFDSEWDSYGVACTCWLHYQSKNHTVPMRLAF